MKEKVCHSLYFSMQRTLSEKFVDVDVEDSDLQYAERVWGTS